LNGVVIAVWDATGAGGKLVLNGIYHIVVECRISDSRSVILSRNVTVMSRNAGPLAEMSAAPNPARNADEISFRVTLSGIPWPVPGKIKIYSIAGELVRVLRVTDGVCKWDMRTAGGMPMATGLYMAVFEGTDPIQNVSVHKTLKVAVIR
jgi:hypothetical protein